ncbi:uncharacterized protein [Littorina saxatilis]|uniref:uncharacterized protein n=1 Tax=Littorina saxatilis TaxID=31220 RepID=UPI0038B421AA
MQLRQLNYVTEDNTFIVRFVSDPKFSSKGFRAVYATSQGKECDATHDRLNGTIRSPTRLSTHTYLPNMACNHSVYLPNSYRIRFYLSRFNLSDLDTGSCTNGDFIHFLDLDSQSEATITCSDDVSSGDLVFESSGSRVEMVFVSDHVYQGEGFEIFYVGVPSCHNETYNTSSGSVSSVNFPRPYSNMQECFYTVNAGGDDASRHDDVTDDVFEVTFQEFFTESDSRGDARLRDELCLRDFLKIIDGKVKHKVCGDWSGLEHLLFFRFRSRSISFRFVSDEQETRRGFNATWQTLKAEYKSSCLSSWVDNEHFYFQVLYHPQTWEDAEADCISRGGHLATVPSNTTQQLLDQHLLQQACTNAEAFWIGSNDRQWESDFYWTDRTKVSFTNWFPGFASSEATDRRYGRQPSDDGQSDEDCVEIRRHFSLPEKGQTITPSFYWNDRSCMQKNPYICQIKPRAVPQPAVECDKNIKLSTSRPEVRLRSPGYPHKNYPDHTNCTYFLHATPSDAILEFDFLDFQLENPAASGRWKDGIFLSGFEAQTLKPLRYGKNSLHAVTDSAVFEYNMTERQVKDWCPFGLKGENPLAMIYDGVRRWPKADHLRCDYDFVEISTSPAISNIGDVSLRKCGDWSRKGKLLRQIVTSSYAFLHFNADHSKTYRGFYVTVRLLKGLYFKFDSYHCALFVCASVSASLWTPETDEELRVVLTHLLAADASNEESSPEITIRSRDNQSCQLVSASGFQVIDNVTVVTHVSKSPVFCNASGLMRMCFRATEKNTREQHHLIDVVNQTEGELQPPLSDDGSNNYTNDAATTWTLQAALGHRVLMLFDDLDIEEQEECLYDRIVIKNSTASRPLCGTRDDTLSALSLKNVAEVSFYSDYSVTGKAFRLSWQSLNMTQCQTQIFTETSAAFSSFNFPSPFPDRIHCFIKIVVQQGSRVLLQFSHILFHNSSEKSIGLSLGRRKGEEEKEEEEKEEEIMVGVEDAEDVVRRVFVSYGNELTVRLEKSVLLAGEGFQASYRTVPRPSDLVFDTAMLTPNSSTTCLSPCYPLPIPDQLSLNSTLRAPIGYVIHMIVHHFRLPFSDDCNDVMEIDDVSLSGEPRRLAKLCGGEDFVNETVSELNSIRITLRTGNTTVGERTKRSISNGEGPFGFNMSLQVYSDPAYLNKTSGLAGGSFDSCAESPCLNNGTCTVVGTRATCVCPLHYAGLFCQVTWCQIQTCLHGNCELTDAEPGFRCRCHDTYFGKRCQMSESQCRTRVCNEAGKCTGNSSQPQCVCDEKIGAYCNITSTSHPLNKTIGELLLGEPIWIGLIVILSVLFLFGVLCLVRRRCAKRFACCQLQIKRKEPGADNTAERRRGGMEPGSHPLTTFNFRRHLLRPPSTTASTNNTAPATPVATRATPIISITKPDDDVITPARPTKTQEELKAEVAARFFASYREAERGPISTPLPTDFSKPTDTFMAQTSEEPAVGPIVGGTLLLDLHHSKSREEHLSRSTLSLGPHGHHRRSSISRSHRERIRRCHSTGPYLLRHDPMPGTPGDASDASESRTPGKSRSLDDRDSLSICSDRDIVYSPGDFRSLDTSLIGQRKLKGSGVDGELEKAVFAAKVGEGSGTHHFFPEVVVHVAHGGHEGDDTSDCSYRNSPTKTKSIQAARPEFLDVQTDSSNLLRVSHADPGRLHHCLSDSALGLIRGAAAGVVRMPGLTEAWSEATLRYKDEMPEPYRKSRSRSGAAVHSFTEYDRSSRRRDDEEQVYYEDVELPPDLARLPKKRDQRQLHHQHTMDSYLEDKLKRRRARAKDQNKRAAGLLRRSSTSPVPFYGYEDEYERAYDRKGKPRRHRRSVDDDQKGRPNSDCSMKHELTHDQRRQSSTESRQNRHSDHRQRRKSSPNDSRRRRESDYHDQWRPSSAERRGKSRNREQSARDRRSTFQRNETVAVPTSTSTTRSHRRGSKRSGHAKLMRKCSSMEIIDSDLHLPPPRALSQEALNACECEECRARDTFSHVSHKPKHVPRSDSRSSGNPRYRAREKLARERRDVYRHKASRSSEASGRSPWTLTMTSESFSSRAEQELQFSKTSSSESERLFFADFKPHRPRAQSFALENRHDVKRSEVGRGVQRRAIEALGSSMSDRESDVSRRELFMKFFSQGVDLEDIISPEEPRFFLGPDPTSMELVSSHSQPHLSTQANNSRHGKGSVLLGEKSKSSAIQSSTSRNPTLQNGKTVHNIPQYSETVSRINNPDGPVLPYSETDGPIAHISKTDNAIVQNSKTDSPDARYRNADSPVKRDRTETLKVTPVENGSSKRPAVLTSKCSVIIYDDDLRRHLSVSNNVSPKRSPVLEECNAPSVNGFQPGVVHVDKAPTPRGEKAQDDVIAAVVDNVTTSNFIDAKNSDPSSHLSVTDTDSAMSSAASRLSSPCCDVVNTSAPPTTVTQTWTAHKAKDSAYQTKESSMDMFESGRDSRRRKSLSTANKAEDRRVTQRLHQAAVTLYGLQQRARKALLSRDSAVNTISEDEDEDQGFQSRYTVPSRRQWTSLDSKNMGEEGENEEEDGGVWEKHRIAEEEEEERESTLDLSRGLNTSPETLPMTVKTIIEEPLDHRECQA